MTDRPSRGWRTALVGGVLAGLAACAAPTGPIPSDPTPAGAPTLRVLQLNLCNSGIAACFTGRAVAAAAMAIHAAQPDVVTLNEICEDDLPALRDALAEETPGASAAAAFEPVRDAATGGPYRCRTGRAYGIGLVARRPLAPGTAGDQGAYPAQVPGDPEQRVWLCRSVTGDPALTACTTHLVDTDRAVAAAQCRYLFGTVVPGVRARTPAPLVVGGDLNLGTVNPGTGDAPDLRSCLPAGSALADDGGVQRVVATPDLVVDGVRTVDLGGTTDHPGLLVAFRAPTGARPAASR